MLQYLILNNHLQSAKAFKHQSPLTWKQILIASFTKGNREQFFSIFQLLRKQQKLDFYLRVYFLIYSIHPFINANDRTSSIPQKEIVSFRQFLDTKGADLAKTSEFLQFYALPFIKKPLEHGTFKTLFSKGWVGNLKQKLMTYIGIQEENMKLAVQGHFSSHRFQQLKKPQKQEPSQNAINKPIPSTSITQKQSAYQQKLRKLEQTNRQLFSELQTIKQSYSHLLQNHQQMIEQSHQYIMESQNKWFQSYKELVKTSRVLLEIVGSLTLENPKLERKYIQSKRKIQKYQRFVSRKLEDLLSMSQDISVFDKLSVNQISQYTMKSGYTSKSWLNNNLGEKNVANYSQLQSINYTQNRNNITSYVEIDEYIGINFTRLNQEFSRLSEHERVEIIQGFTWRLLKSKSAGIRRFYCISLIANNFMGLGRVDKNVKQKSEQLQVCVKYLGDNMVGDSLLQLLNYMKVDYYSRQWFFLQHNITEPLMQTMAEHLQSNNLQSFLICLDILSTISAYKDYRESIVSSELPIFLLNVLESYPKLFQSQELMQLIMMILMNVSAFPQGIQLLAQYENIFSTLSVAFQHQYHDIIMLVNGFYYTLLSSKPLYDLAIESNMPEFVKFLLSSPQYNEHQRQLIFIQSRLQKYQENNNPPKRPIDNSKSPTNNRNNNDKSPNKQHQQQQNLFLVDSENQYDEIEIFEEEEQMQNLQQYIKAHENLSTKYPLNEVQTQQQQKQIQSINLGFIKNIQLKKLSLNDKNQSKNQKNQNQIKNIDNAQEPSKLSMKNIPQQSKLKKPTINLKTQESQLTIIDLSNKSNPNLNIVNKKKNQPQQQPTVKQQIFNTPPPKIDTLIEAEQPIPGNTKQAQFMGYLSKQKNPTFAKQKTEPIQKFGSPTVPISQNLKLPNFGTYQPPCELGPEQKTRRKQVLKQLNEQIQSKQKQKVEKHKSKLQFDKVIEQNKEGAFSKKKQSSVSQMENGSKAVRGNALIKKEEPVNQKPVIKQKEQQRKAFESRPKIHRTPPKEDQ